MAATHDHRTNLAACAAIAFACALPTNSDRAVAAEPAVTCNRAENAEFDFWVGEWDVVFAADGRAAGYSLIEKLYGGCALRENWRGNSGYAGGSLNFYDPSAARWRQTWIGSDGVPTDYVGGREGPAMVFRATLPGEAPGRSRMMRMTFSPVGAGEVRQLIEASDDAGATWRAEYDLTYQRR